MLGIVPFNGTTTMHIQTPSDNFEFKFTYVRRSQIRVSWGDGAIEVYAGGSGVGNPSHIYASPGEYKIEIEGLLEGFGTGNGTASTKAVKMLIVR